MDNYVPGWANTLYFVACDDQIKIGISDKPDRRLATMRTGNTRPMTMIAVLPALGWQEKVWHAAFQHLRVAGEWFRDSDELRDAISAATAGNDWIPSLRHPYRDAEDAHQRFRASIADLEERAEIKALSKQANGLHALGKPDPRACTATEHRCEALALGFFAILNTGADDLTRAAVEDCNRRDAAMMGEG